MNETLRHPQVLFSSWTPWAACFSNLELKAPGVYALARFPGPAPSVVDLTDANICYFGETCGQSLETRLWQFSRSAFEAKNGHSGGWTYRDRFNDDGSKLWVSAFQAVDMQDPLRSAYIRHVERELIWNWALAHGRLPACNSK